MNSWKHAPLHTVGGPLHVMYMEGLYDSDFTISEYDGIVESSEWVKSAGRNHAYGWLILLKLEDGSYRYIYECKCMMISSAKEKRWSQRVSGASLC